MLNFIINNFERTIKGGLLLAFFLSVQACGVYSFTGAATNAKTMQIEPFFNNTDLGQANLGIEFTNGLKNYFQQNSSLAVVKENGQLSMTGAIVEYKLSPQAPVQTSTGLSQAELTRLSISIKVEYVDSLEPKNSFKDKSFSFFADFPSTQDFQSVRSGLEKKIMEQIYLDIFNATLANW